MTCDAPRLLPIPFSSLTKKASLAMTLIRLTCTGFCALAMATICVGISNSSGNDASAAAPADIVDTAVQAGSFQTLAAALTAADLIETLKGDGPFTVFAPTDDAFAKLPKGTVDGLLKDKKKLAKILTYHVVPGKVLAADVVKLKSAKTVEGDNVAISASGKGVKIDGANVVKTDIICTNGVIHVIDSVLMPK